MTGSRISGIVDGLTKGRAQVERERLGDPALVSGDGSCIAFSTEEGLWIYSTYKVEEVEVTGNSMMFVLSCGVTYLIKAHESILIVIAEAWESGRLRKIRAREGVEIQRIVATQPQN
jgi:hypothetical protein